ncbi:YoaK family protein [Sphingomonas sp.]|uniref:YoaK family protein n=1 Tax=Sphingomonas sp. TaxID=28214 RepID=UPI003B00BC22
MLESPTPDRKATVLLLLAIAGCVDAIGLAETGRYFVSFMSGNTTQAGLALAYGDWAGTVAPLGLVALFVGGATLGTLVVERAAKRTVPVLLIVEAALLALAWMGFGSSRPMLGVVLLAVAMGLANIVTAQGPGPHPGVTYATGALVRVGTGLAALGRARGGAARLAFDVASWLALLGGAVGGALARLRYGMSTLAALAAVVALLGLVELVTAKRRVEGSGR